jgi:hypothetical protein
MSNLTYVYRTVRRARAGFPGAIEEGAYRVEGSTVFLYDKEGKTLLGKEEIIAPFNAHETARRMLKRKPSHGGSFNRPLQYEKISY